MTWNPVQNRTYVANYYGSSVSVIRDVVGIEENAVRDAQHLMLEISPNPIYSSTKVKYVLEKSSSVSLNIYNASGQCVRTLVNSKKNPGVYEVNWNGKDNGNNMLPQGIYFLRMQVGNYTATKKIVLLH